jgi:hypothetical protein
MVIGPRPNPETVEVLLDATWRTATAEGERTATLDRKAATLATFASLLLSLVAATGPGMTRPGVGRSWLFVIYVSGLAEFLLAIGLAVWVLLPTEQLTLGMSYVSRFRMWSALLERPDEVRGEIMATLITGIARERALNGSKAVAVRAALLLLLVGLVSIVVDAAIVAAHDFFR